MPLAFESSVKTILTSKRLQSYFFQIPQAVMQAVPCSFAFRIRSYAGTSFAALSLIMQKSVTSTIENMTMGAIAGTIATIPMTMFIKAVHALLPRYQQDPIPPQQITERATGKAGFRDKLTSNQRRYLGVIAHFLFGAGAGTFYGFLERSTRPPAFLGGIAFGLGVWTCSYLGWLPAMGLYRKPRHESSGRHFMMIGAHIIWGGILGLLVEMSHHSSGNNERRWPNRP